MPAEAPQRRQRHARSRACWRWASGRTRSSPRFRGYHRWYQPLRAGRRRSGLRRRRRLRPTPPARSEAVLVAARELGPVRSWPCSAAAGTVTPPKRPRMGGASRARRCGGAHHRQPPLQGGPASHPRGGPVRCSGDPLVEPDRRPPSRSDRLPRRRGRDQPAGPRVGAREVAGVVTPFDDRLRRRRAARKRPGGTVVIRLLLATGIAALVALVGTWLLIGGAHPIATSASPSNEGSSPRAIGQGRHADHGQRRHRGRRRAVRVPPASNLYDWRVLPGPDWPPWKRSQAPGPVGFLDDWIKIRNEAEPGPQQAIQDPWACCSVVVGLRRVIPVADQRPHDDQLRPLRPGWTPRQGSGCGVRGRCWSSSPRPSAVDSHRWPRPGGRVGHLRVLGLRSSATGSSGTRACTRSTSDSGSRRGGHDGRVQGSCGGTPPGADLPGDTVAGHRHWSGCAGAEQLDIGAAAHPRLLFVMRPCR